jgi:hypothetical protein
MPGLLEALFDAGRKTNDVSKRLSLASLPSSVDDMLGGQAEQATISAEKCRDSSEADWPRELQNAKLRFGQQHAKLFPLLGCKVRTPEGAGTLIQVFAERVTVLLDSERDKCSVFTPAQIEPVSME